MAEPTDDERAEEIVELRARLQEAEKHILHLEWANQGNAANTANLLDTLECVKAERNRLREENARLKSLTSLRVASES